MQYLKDEVRNKIFSAAIQEFKENGYQDASIRSIATIAGISLGNIYRYYKNKEDLYLAVVSPLMESVEEFARSKTFSSSEDTEKSVAAVLDFLMKHEDEILIIRKGNTKHYKKFQAFLVEEATIKIKNTFDTRIESIDEKISNPNLIKIIARAFLHSLFDILGSSACKEERKKYVHEIIMFFFGRLSERF